MRAIDADAIVVHKFPSEDYDPSENDAEKAYRKGWNDALDAVAEFQPSAEPVRMKGRWERVYPSRSKSYLRFCSVCREQCWYCGTGDYDFCPNCGASMSEGEDDDNSNLVNSNL